MLDILSAIPGRKRSTPSGWHVFNAVCCHHRGHNPDKRQRAGVKYSDGGGYSYHCFNCGFKCGYTPGKHYTKNFKELLAWCGLDRVEVERLSFASFTNRTDDPENSAPPVWLPEFNEVPLPDGARPLDPARDRVHYDYLAARAISPELHQFYTVDGERRQRIIIPFYWGGKIVGHTSRYYDGRHPKYISERQRGYVYNYDAQRSDWAACILVEGQFDALSIGGCACMSNTVGDEQAMVLARLSRPIIYVPDRDKAGLEACSRALELGYKVSIPEWGPGVKDVNDAVVRYGKLPTLLSILGAATSSRIVVELKRKKIA